jgi:DNA replication protein DnaC
LTELELLDRERRATERRIRQAKFDAIKSLDSFEFPAIPSLDKTPVLELTRCEFIERKENVLALGNSGTGKTHLALALGLAACQKGFRVRFTTAASLAHELIEARDERRLMRFQKCYPAGSNSARPVRLVADLRRRGRARSRFTAQPSGS